MSAPRLAAIPFEHLEAEIAAFPLASEASIRLGEMSLNPLVSGHDALWRAAERELMEALPSVSLDEAVAIRDKPWFSSANTGQHWRPVEMGSYLRQLAETYLDDRGRPIRLLLCQPVVKEPSVPKRAFAGAG